jgi:hypothetical protein
VRTAPRPFPERAPPVGVPAGWRLQTATGPAWFVTRARYQRPDGTTVEWTSRRHRKGLGLRVPRPEVARRRGPSRMSVAMGALFMLGSACFAIGPLPAYTDAVSDSTVAWTFFVGSIFFTTAAYLQYHEAALAPADADTTRRRPLRRLLALSPRRLDWWACALQLVGTLFFNVSTFAATRVELSVVQQRHWIWAPDVYGSVCFLLASWLAYAEAGAGEHGVRGRSLGWWISDLNLIGSVAFGVSAVAARLVHATGEIANLPLANLGTLVGAVCFFAGAALLPVESATGDRSSLRRRVRSSSGG